MITLCNRQDAPIVLFSFVATRLLCALQRGTYSDSLVMMVESERVEKITLSPLETVYHIHLRETIAP